MFQLDDNFLQELGLGNLPEEQKQAFLQHIYSELELRVGQKLSEGLTEAQLEQFEAFVDRNEGSVRTWVAANVPDYAVDPAFQQLQQATPQGTDEVALLAEYASLKWLGMNRPDYRDVVAGTLNELKQEIATNRDAILGAES